MNVRLLKTGKKQPSAGIIRIFCFSVIVAGLLLNASIGNAVEVVDRIVAVVNDDIISLFDLNDSYHPFEDRIRSMGYSTEKQQEMLYKLREDIINQLIEQKLTEQETQRAGIVVDEQEIDRAVERMKQANYMTDEEFRKALAGEGLTMADYRKNLRLQLLRNRLVSREVTSKIVITEEDVKDYFEKYPEVFKEEKKYHLRTILLKIPEFAGETEKLAARLKMEEIYKKLKNGESFEQLARKYSDGMADKGGDLGSFPFQKLSVTVQDAIKNLQKGEFSEILDTDLGYQIFYIEDIAVAEKKNFEQASTQIKQKLMDENVDKKIRSWLEELRKKSHIRIVR